MHLKITCIILLIPSITTTTVFQSLLSSKLQNGFRTPFWTIVVNCCTEPPDVKFVTAHAASFWDLKSPYQRNTEQVQFNVKNEHLETNEIMHIIKLPDLWRIKTALMSLAILFHLCAQHVSDINIPIIRSLRLCCWITTLVVFFLVRCALEFRCGWVGVV